MSADYPLKGFYSYKTKRITKIVQAAGVEPGQAGNAVQLIVFFGICIGYISTYIFRVANKARVPSCADFFIQMVLYRGRVVTCQ